MEINAKMDWNRLADLSNSRLCFHKSSYRYDAPATGRMSNSMNASSAVLCTGSVIQVVKLLFQDCSDCRHRAFVAIKPPSQGGYPQRSRAALTKLASSLKYPSISFPSIFAYINPL